MTAVIVLAGLMLALCSGSIAVDLFSSSDAQKSTGPAREATSRFVADLESGQEESAYNRLCAETAGSFTPIAFFKGLDEQLKIRSHEIVGVSVSDSNGRESATVIARLTRESDLVDQHTFELVKERGQWKVCGQPF